MSMPGNYRKSPSRVAELTDMQLHVTQACGTEPPFQNQFWNNKRLGIYVDIVSGEPLFSSTDKFDSGTGWPSFTQPLKKNYAIEKKDTGYGMVRTEVRSKHVGSHLEHTAKTLITEMTASRKWPEKIVTEITPASEFYIAEGYHQDYLKRYPDGYTCHYVRSNWKL